MVNVDMSVRDQQNDTIVSYDSAADEMDVTGVLNIGSGTSISETVRGTNTTDVAEISANSTANVSVTVTGAALGDECMASSSADPGDLGITCRITAADTCNIRLRNDTGSPIDPASMTYGCRTFAP